MTENNYFDVTLTDVTTPDPHLGRATLEIEDDRTGGDGIFFHATRTGTAPAAVAGWSSREDAVALRDALLARYPLPTAEDKPDAIEPVFEPGQKVRYIGEARECCVNPGAIVTVVTDVDSVGDVWVSLPDGGQCFGQVGTFEPVVVEEPGDPTDSVVYVTGDTDDWDHGLDAGTEVTVIGDDYAMDGTYLVKTATGREEYVAAVDLDVEPPTKFAVGDRVAFLGLVGEVVRVLTDKGFLRYEVKRLDGYRYPVGCVQADSPHVGAGTFPESILEAFDGYQVGDRVQVTYGEPGSMAAQIWTGPATVREPVGGRYVHVKMDGSDYWGAFEPSEVTPTRANR